MTLTVQPVNPYKIPPWRNWAPFTDSSGILTREAEDYLNNLVNRAGGVIGPLSADVLEGQTWEEPGKIGSITPNTAKVTFFEANRDVNIVPITAAANPTLGIPASLGVAVINPQAQGSINNVNIGAVTPRSGAFTSVTITGGFGCNGAAPQVSYTLGAAVATTAATNTTPYGFTTAAQANDLVTRVNAILAALKANGIGV